jgi:hypothetical protein
MHDIRKTLESTGLHVAAIRRLPLSYSAEEYLAALDLARATCAGERYADMCLGVDVDSLLREVEEAGDDVVRAAEANLRRRGIDPDAATYQQYADALVEASP